MKYDLFISYSRKDCSKEKIEALVQHIKDEFRRYSDRELNVFVDYKEIEGMDDWRQSIYQALRESSMMLACLSPKYLQSNYCEWEFIEYTKHEIGHLYGYNGIAPIYYIQVEGWETDEFDKQCADWIKELRRRQHFDLRPWNDQGKFALNEAAVSDRMEQLNKKIKETIEKGERANRNIGNMDSHNPNFVGRTSLLRTLRDGFVKRDRIGVIATVNSVGGLGKTALAIEYAHAFADEYGGGCWIVRCAGKKNLGIALSELASSIGFEFSDNEKLDPSLQLQRVRRELKQRCEQSAPHRCLIVLDNVDAPDMLDPADIAKLNIGDWLHIIATTRLGDDDLGKTSPDRWFLPVNELDEGEAVALIESYQPRRAFASEEDRRSAIEIVKLLGCFTLAVESAAVYLGEYAGEVTCAGFLKRLQKDGLAGLDSASSESKAKILHDQKSLRATLGPTLSQLRPEELRVLEYAALLPPDIVPLSWLRDLASTEFPQLGIKAEPGFRDPWISLYQHLYSLRILQPAESLENQSTPRLARVHRLVQELVLGQIEEVVVAERRTEVEEYVFSRVQAIESGTDWTGVRWEVDALEAMAWKLDAENHEQASWMLKDVGCFLYTGLAEWSRGEAAMARALEIDQKSYGEDHPDVAICLNNLAQLLKATNRHSEAEPLMRRVIEIFEKSYGKDHPKVATSLNNLASLYYSTNRLAEAEPKLRRALEIDENSYGKNHPKVATSLNNLAQLLQATNRLAEAEPLMRRALEIDENSYGKDHPNVAIRLNNLAGLLKDTNRQTEAEPLMRRALEIDENSCGKDHPNVAIRLNNLASLLQATNRLAEAEPLMRRALEIDEKSYGKDHPNVATRLNNLASLYYSTNRLAEAEPKLRRALEILVGFLRATGHAHPNLDAAANNYCAILDSLGGAEGQLTVILALLAPELFEQPPSREAAIAFAQQQLTEARTSGNETIALILEEIIDQQKENEQQSDG